jgi:hypothetical protein
LKTYPFSVSILSDYAVDNWTLYADLGSFYGNVDLSTPHIPIPAAEEVIIGLELTPWESNGEYSFTIYFMGSNGEVLGGLPVFVVIDNKTAIDFTPKIDGFRFRNLCTERFEEMFIDYYGRNNVLLPDGDLRLTAREWYDKRYQKCIGGASCFGFSAASLLYYYYQEYPETPTDNPFPQLSTKYSLIFHDYGNLYSKDSNDIDDNGITTLLVLRPRSSDMFSGNLNFYAAFRVFCQR